MMTHFRVIMSIHIRKIILLPFKNMSGSKSRYQFIEVLLATKAVIFQLLRGFMVRDNHPHLRPFAPMDRSL